MTMLVEIFAGHYGAHRFWGTVEAVDLVLYFDDVDVCISKWDAGRLLPDV